jgi:4-amino-4-deoxy-L-arabinose transferase-like glycosyltransferase
VVLIGQATAVTTPPHPGAGSPPVDAPGLAATTAPGDTDGSTAAAPRGDFERPAPATARRPGWLRRLPLAILALVAAGFLVLGIFGARSDSPTYDEPVYAASGVAALLHQELEFNAEHPPLPKALAALPVLLAHPVVPGDTNCSGDRERDCSADFAHAQEAAGKLRDVTFASRIVPLIETVGVAFAAYALAAELFGALAGGLAGLLWLLSPVVLGIGHLDGTDTPFALAVTLSSLALARWLRLGTTRALLWAGAALAITAGTSISGALVVLACLVVIAGASRRSGARRVFANVGLAAAVAWVGLWIPYVILDQSVLLHPTVIAPLPYLRGLSYLASYNAGGMPGYLAGVAYTGGRWWFWPVSMAIKYPAAIIVLLVAGAIALFWTDRSVRWRTLAAVGVPAVVLAAFTVASPLNIGLRLLLPVIALWCVAASALVPVVARLRLGWRRIVVPAIAALLVAAGVGTALSNPNSLSSTQPPFGPGYAAATDSNVDWGQGLYALQSWSRGRDPWVAYFGPRGLTVADVPGARSLLDATPTDVTGWVAVSATALTSSDRAKLAWLRNYCPVRVLAGSILVYHFAQPPEVAAAPARPAAVCAGTSSVRVGQR